MEDNKNISETQSLVSWPELQRVDSPCACRIPFPVTKLSPINPRACRRDPKRTPPAPFSFPFSGKDRGPPDLHRPGVLSLEAQDYERFSSGSGWRIEDTGALQKSPEHNSLAFCPPSLTPVGPCATRAHDVTPTTPTGPLLPATLPFPTSYTFTPRTCRTLKPADLGNGQGSRRL